MATTVFAQSPFDKRNFMLNGGAGISSLGLPFYMGLDYVIIKDISLGAESLYINHEKSDKNSIVKSMSANGNYHFGSVLGLPKNIDIYGGLNLGLFQRIPGMGSSYKFNSGVQAGARYFFRENLAINVEAGTGNVFSVAKFGLTILTN